MRPPPLLEPGPDLTPDQVRRYARQLRLPEIGREGQRRLLAARVLVVGAGGLGSPVLQYLAAAGVGTLGVVDDDVVEESNLQRQVVHTTADLGSAKAGSAARAVAALNPSVRVVPHPFRLDGTSIGELLAAYDLVVDGSDNFATRFLLDDRCRAVGLPLVWGAVLAGAGQVSLAWAPHGPTYRDVVPEPPPPGSVPACSEAGVLGPTVATIGSLMAAEVLKVVTGSGELLLGRVLVLDSFAATVRTLTVGVDPRAAAGRGPAVTAVRPATPEIDVADLGGNPTLVDVRDEIEVEVDGEIPGAVRLPPGWWEGDRGGLPPGRLVLVCSGGARSAALWAELDPADRDRTASLRGGLRAWRAAGGRAG
ncbi:ThiF family adenylyltransferase [Kineococcus gynurae]|uniref:ThiF family adenylyltransferase n=1 Tax=Kineococcus gynurae TaxID=452979 RepID=A0ABV5LUC1_9ACTN